MKKLKSIFEQYHIKKYDEYGKKNFYEVCSAEECEFLGK